METVGNSLLKSYSITILKKSIIVILFKICNISRLMSINLQKGLSDTDFRSQTAAIQKSGADDPPCKKDIKLAVSLPRRQISPA